MKEKIFLLVTLAGESPNNSPLFCLLFLWVLHLHKARFSIQASKITKSIPSLLSNARERALFILALFVPLLRNYCTVCIQPRRSVHHVETPRTLYAWLCYTFVCNQCMLQCHINNTIPSHLSSLLTPHPQYLFFQITK